MELLHQYLSVYGIEASVLSFSMAFSYFYLTLISEVEEELKREIPWLHNRGPWFTKGEARKVKKKANRRFWIHVRKKLEISAAR